MRHRTGVDNGEPGKRPIDTNPAFRSNQGNPFKDQAFMGAAKGVTEGRTPYTLVTSVGLVVLKQPTAIMGTKPTLELVGVVVHKLPPGSRLELEPGMQVIDTLFARYIVRAATEAEITALGPELKKHMQAWTGLPAEQRLAPKADAMRLPAHVDQK